MLDESSAWSPQRIEPLLSSTEGLVARAIGFEPRRHAGASPGVVCLALLRAMRLELDQAGSKVATTALRDLVAVKWRIASKATLEEVVVVDPDAVPGGSPARLSAELAQELHGAVKLPNLLIVALEGPRAIVVDETVCVRGQATYHTFAFLVNGLVVTRQEGSSQQGLPGTAYTVDGGVLVSDVPAVVVLVHERVASVASWTPWLGLFPCPRIPATPAAKTFRLGLITTEQYECMARLGHRSGCSEEDMFGVFELPVDAKASLLQARLASIMMRRPCAGGAF